MNIMALHFSGDKHPHKMRSSRKAIQALLEKIRAGESKGLIYQAALLMKELVGAHIFDGGNHRTAYGVGKMFLRRNAKRFRVTDFKNEYSFIKNLGNKTLEEIQKWIRHGTDEESE